VSVCLLDTSSAARKLKLGHHQTRRHSRTEPPAVVALRRIRLPQDARPVGHPRARPGRGAVAVWPRVTNELLTGASGTIVVEFSTRGTRRPSSAPTSPSTHPCGGYPADPTASCSDTVVMVVPAKDGHRDDLARVGTDPLRTRGAARTAGKQLRRMPARELSSTRRFAISFG
jgi:hypothetical protein